MIPLLIMAFYLVALYILWRIMLWDDRGRTLLSYAVLLFYACGLAVLGPVAVVAYALTHTAPSTCTCEMVKNHECTQK